MEKIISKDSRPASSEGDACSEDGGAPHSGKINEPNSPYRSSSASPQIKRKKMADTTGEASASRVKIYYSPPLRGETPSSDSSSNSNTLLTNPINPTDKVLGFIGLGMMGSGMVKRLLNSGHQVHVWDMDPEKCQEFARIGATPQMAPSHVVGSADIIFSCVSDSTVVKELVFRQDGVYSKMDASKAYVEMTSIDAATSALIADVLKEKGARYLETMLIGSKAEAEKGTLTLLVAGDVTVFDDVSSCFEAIGAVSIFLGDVGAAIKVNLIHKMCMGTAVAGLGETMALVDRAGLNQDVFMELLAMGFLGSPLIMEQGKAIANRDFSTRYPLTQAAKDMRLVEGLADSVTQPVPLTSAVSQVFLSAERSGYGDLDSSAVYLSSIRR